MRAVKDHRCLSFPNEPYSAYCKVCWYPVYTIWIDKEPPGGKCFNGCTDAAQCIEAKNRAKDSAVMEKMKEKTPSTEAAQDK